MSLSGEVFSGGATTSQHIEAQDDDHFENTTFKLKRTRSMGLLDEFIPDKLKNKMVIIQKQIHQQQLHQQPAQETWQLWQL